MIPHSRPTLGPEEKRAVEAVLDSGQIAQGQKVVEFEKSLCKFTGRRYAVAVSSGTAALQLSFLALGISRGDEVMIPSFTCVALLHAIEAAGARPVVTDIRLEDFNLSLSEVKKKIRRKTKAIVVPHAFGLPAPIEKLKDLGISLIEDGTQALGAQIGQKRVGSFGILSLFSFYATKMITTGEGGMVLTDSPRLVERLHDLRDYDKKASHRFRTNSKMTDLGAAIGVEQLQKLPAFIQRRREIAACYRKALEGQEAVLPPQETDRNPVYYRFVVRVPRKVREWTNRLRVRGVDIKEPIFKPIHQYLNLLDSRFPMTVQAFRECRSFPLYPSLSDEECGQVCQIVQEEALRLRPERIQVLAS